MADLPKIIQPRSKIYLPLMSVAFSVGVVAAGVGIWWLAAVSWVAGVGAAMLS